MSQETCKKLVALFNRAPIQASTGMILSYNEKTEAIFDMPYQEKFNHGMGDVHGGIIATLLDNAGWFTAAAHAGKWVVTSDLNIRILEGALTQDLKAIGHLVRLEKRLIVCQMEVYSKDSRLIANGSGSFMISSKEIS